MQKKRKETRTYADRAEYLKKASLNRRAQLRQRAREYRGGKCILCAYDRCQRALVFHHVHPEDKEFGIAYKGLNRTWEKIKKEIDKCVLLCSNCHMEVHDGISHIPERIIKELRRTE